MPLFDEQLGRQVLRALARHSLAILLSTTALGVASAHAQDATWTGVSGEWTNSASWTPATVPTGTATFSNTGTTNVANNGGPVTIGELLFTAAQNAQAYTISTKDTFTVNGTGIVNNSTNSQTFTTGTSGPLVFQNGATASGGTGGVQITVGSLSSMSFANTSTAGTASIQNFSLVQFHDTSTAGSAGITNPGQIDFLDGSSAGSAGISGGNLALLNFKNT